MYNLINIFYDQMGDYSKLNNGKTKIQKILEKDPDPLNKSLPDLIFFQNSKFYEVRYELDLKKDEKDEKEGRGKLSLLLLAAGRCVYGRLYWQDFSSLFLHSYNISTFNHHG